MQSRRSAEHNKEDPEIPLPNRMHPSKNRGGHKQVGPWGSNLHEGYWGWSSIEAFERKWNKTYLQDCGFNCWKFETSWSLKVVTCKWVFFFNFLWNHISMMKAALVHGVYQVSDIKLFFSNWLQPLPAPLARPCPRPRPCQKKPRKRERGAGLGQFLVWRQNSQATSWSMKSNQTYRHLSIFLSFCCFDACASLFRRGWGSSYSVNLCVPVIDLGDTTVVKNHSVLACNCTKCPLVTVYELW